MQRQLFAAKSDARGTDQKDLFLNEVEALAPTYQMPPAETEEESTTVAGHQRKKRGRESLDPTLPRDIGRHELPESERVCAYERHTLVEIGSEISEQMHVIPEQVRVLQHHRIKYACACCDLSLKVATTPARIIPRGVAVRLCTRAQRRARREAVCRHRASMRPRWRSSTTFRLIAMPRTQLPTSRTATINATRSKSKAQHGSGSK